MNIKLDRLGVSEDFCAQCFVARMADLSILNWRADYVEAQQGGSLNALKYISKMRTWCANEIGISPLELVRFESSLATGATEDNINKILAKWGVPLRLSKELWIEMDIISGIEQIDLEKYLSASDLTVPYIINGPLGFVN